MFEAQVGVRVLVDKLVSGCLLAESIACLQDGALHCVDKKLLHVNAAFRQCQIP